LLRPLGARDAAAPAEPEAAGGAAERREHGARQAAGGDLRPPGSVRLAEGREAGRHHDDPSHALLPCAPPAPAATSIQFSRKSATASTESSRPVARDDRVSGPTRTAKPSGSTTAKASSSLASSPRKTTSEPGHEAAISSLVAVPLVRPAARSSRPPPVRSRRRPA